MDLAKMIAHIEEAAKVEEETILAKASQEFDTRFEKKKSEIEKEFAAEYESRYAALLVEYAADLAEYRAAAKERILKEKNIWISERIEALHREWEQYCTEKAGELITRLSREGGPGKWTLTLASEAPPKELEMKQIIELLSKEGIFLEVNRNSKAQGIFLKGTGTEFLLNWETFLDSQEDLLKEILSPFLEEYLL
jgi:hypothetical protein